MNPKIFYSICIMLGITGTFSSCAKKITLTNTGVAPAAEAYAKIKQDKSNNYHIEVKATHLAPSENLNPPKKTYVLWMITENNGIKNIGQFQSGTALLSKTLKGSVETITAFTPVSFFITAEDAGAINSPGNMVILK